MCNNYQHAADAPEHAMLTPSAADRWLNCAPSARLCALLRGDDTEYSAEGREAHIMAARMLGEAYHNKLLNGTDFDKRVYDKADAMTRHAAGYVEYVMDIAGGRPILIEQRLSLTPWAPEGFGTADAITWKVETHPDGEGGTIEGHVLHVIDFKYGQGFAVEVRDNPQLMLYALGAWTLLERLDGVKPDFVKLHIYQPRRGGASSQLIDVDDLLAHYEFQLKPGIKAAHAGHGEYNCGAWCAFCDAHPLCARWEREAGACDKARRLASGLIDDAAVTRWLSDAPHIIKWLTRVQAYAKRAMKMGKRYPGHRLVMRPCGRKWISEGKAAAAAKAAGVPYHKIYTRTMVSPSRLEKVMGAAAFDDALGNLVETEYSQSITNKPDDTEFPPVNETVNTAPINITGVY